MSLLSCPLTAFFENKPFRAGLDFDFVDVQSFLFHNRSRKRAQSNFSPKLAKGEIASLSGAGDDPRYFQISVPVQPGNSGGALVDERGNVGVQALACRAAGTR